MDYTAIAKGKPLPKDLRQHFHKNQEIAKAEILNNALTFLFIVPSPTKSEIEDLQGPLEIGLSFINDIIFLPMKGLDKGFLYSDNPLDYRLVMMANPSNDYLEGFKDLADDQGALCHFLVVDSANQFTVCINRIFSLSNEFTKEFVKCLKKQCDNFEGFSALSYNQKVASLQGQFSVDDIFNRSSMTSKIGV